MSVSYTRPLGTAWSRMAGILFRPFDLVRWLALGFTAWLASLGDWDYGGLEYVLGDDDDGGGPRILDQGVDFFSETWQRVLAGGLIAYLVVMVVLVLIAFGLLLIWLSSRGKFMFLDNVVHGRSRIAEPWGRYGRLGTSLFLWRVGYNLALFVLLALAVVAAVALIVPIATTGSWTPMAIALVAFAGLIVLLIGLAAAFVSLLVENFVIPVMYRFEVPVLEAWRRFLPILSAHPGEFILYGVFVFMLWLGVTVAVITFGFLTCCVGFMLVSLPYLGALLLLPVHVAYRVLGPEFLGQFAPDYATLRKEPAAEAAPGGSPPRDAPPETDGPADS